MRLSSMRALFALALSALGLAACSSKAPSQKAVDPSPTSAEGEAFAAALCARFNRCSPMLVKLTWGNDAACNARFALAMTPVFRAPGSRVDVASLKACTDAIAASACSVELTTLEACNFRGERADGAACSWDTQCKSGACSYGYRGFGFHAGRETYEPLPYLSEFWKCGKCQPRVGEGAACDKNECALDLRCGADDRCFRPGGLGQPCVSSKVSCRTGLACIDGACAAPLPAGEVCEGGYTRQCDTIRGDVCNYGGDRNNTTGTCRPAVARQVGEPCNLNAGETCALSACWPRGLGDSYSCLPYIPDGRQCGHSEPYAYLCEPPASCGERYCELPGGTCN
jgi:hypothetical protein